MDDAEYYEVVRRKEKGGDGNGCCDYREHSGAFECANHYLAEITIAFGQKKDSPRNEQKYTDRDASDQEPK